MTGRGWFAVRCVFEIGGLATGSMHTYEERITLWRASGFDEAIALAEAEAAEYASALGAAAYLGLAQCFQIVDDAAHGAEVFSLMRDSRHGPGKYVAKFFDTLTTDR